MQVKAFFSIVYVTGSHKMSLYLLRNLSCSEYVSETGKQNCCYLGTMYGVQIEN